MEEEIKKSGIRSNKTRIYGKKYINRCNEAKKIRSGSQSTLHLPVAEVFKQLFH